MSSRVDRAEWLRLMRELAATDREAYRRLRAEIWQRISETHATKSPAEIAAWTARAN